MYSKGSVWGSGLFGVLGSGLFGGLVCLGVRFVLDFGLFVS